MEEISQCKERNERVLVTTLTKRMAEELTDYLLRAGISTAYIHSDVDTIDRVQIMDDLRQGIYTVLVGVNLLREGLDLPEVALVAILDADKEGFLRSTRSLTQTAGRAARNVNGRVIMYAKEITASMQQTIDETERRRLKQMHYNEVHHITPSQIVKAVGNSYLTQLHTKDSEKSGATAHAHNSAAAQRVAAHAAMPVEMVAEESPVYGRATKPASPILADPSLSPAERKAELQKKMKEAAARFDFILAAQYRDELLKLEADDYPKLLVDGIRS